MEKVYKKLVRDRIPEIIEQKGAKPITRVLNSKDYKKELEKKLLEECKEVLEATDRDDRIEELADVLELIRSLGVLESVTLEQILEIADEKNIKRGGFEKRIFLERVLEP